MSSQSNLADWGMISRIVSMLAGYSSWVMQCQFEGLITTLKTNIAAGGKFF
jgi:hypothetical protein